MTRGRRVRKVATLTVIGLLGGLGSAEAAGDIGTQLTVATQTADRVHPPARSLLIVGTGDVLTESAVLDAATTGRGGTDRYDFTRLFAPIAPIIAGADLAICHMELPMGLPGERPGVYGRSQVGGNLLLAPYELAASIRAVGFDRCSTASNHSHDLGAPGIASTLAALDDAGLGHAGTARSNDEAVVRVFDVTGVAVAHLSYTTFANSPPLPEPSMNFAGSVGEVVGQVRAARAAGAEIVVLSLHIAKEMLSVPMSYDRAFVEQLTAAADVDLVIEHGPHVIQPVEMVNGAVVYWSVGNLISGMGVPGTGKYEDQRTLDGLIAGVRFTETTPGRFEPEVWTTLICGERWGRTVWAPLGALAVPELPPELRQQLEACVARSVGVVPDIH